MQPVSRTKEFQTIHQTRHFHPFVDHRTINPGTTRVMVKGKGLYLWDSDGRRYLDGMSGLWCTAVGYGREELIDAATNQMRELAYGSQYFNTTHNAVAELSDKLFSLLPKQYSRIAYCNSGSEANETLIRMVRLYWQTVGKPGKKLFIGRVNGYHGSTVGSASLGGMAHMHAMGDLPIPGIVHIGEPYWFGYQGTLTEAEFGLHMARELEEKILALGADKVAAFVAEPFQGAGGMIFPPSTYWPEIQRICRQYEVLLCADEVIGGFGRTGEWFAHQHFEFEPDTISIAKGLTSGYVPMGGLILSRQIAETLVERGGAIPHGFTYQGHPVAAAVALANLKLLDDHGIVDEVKSDLGPYLQNALREVFAGHPLVGEIQGTGAVAALQLTDANVEEKSPDFGDVAGTFCMMAAIEEGLICRSGRGRMILAPSLVATHAEVDEMTSKIKKAVDSTAEALCVM